MWLFLLSYIYNTNWDYNKLDIDWISQLQLNIDWIYVLEYFLLSVLDVQLQKHEMRHGLTKDKREKTIV